MIIGVCGYSSSGSSAVTDYLKEFSSTKVLDDFELLLITYPDGIESLDYYLNQHISKYASSDVAINRFKNYTNLLAKKLDKSSCGRFSELTSQYIVDITQVTWRGYGATDDIIFNSSYLNIIIRKVLKAKIIPFIEKFTKKKVDFYPVREMYFSVQPKEFLNITKEYLKSILLSMGANSEQIIVLNQPFSGNNPIKSFKYFDNPKAIIVDRDPRDMYIFAKKFLLGAGRAIPTDNVESFVAYYKNLREDKSLLNDKRILKIQFEDMIYNYENTTKKILDFCEINKEDRFKEIFEPSRSVNNTQVYKKFKGYERDIIYIETELLEYLYDFNSVSVIKAEGNMFYGRSEKNK